MISGAGGLTQWIGKTETQVDEASSKPLRALAAALDRNDVDFEAGSVIPPCWHWLYFLSLPRQSEIGPDGHARRGSFLPPAPLPRRMWAASRLKWLVPLRVGQTITRSSRIVDMTSKDGRTGPLVFVCIRHEVSCDGDLAIIEEQDIAYRDAPQARWSGTIASCAAALRLAAGNISGSRSSVSLFRAHV